MEDQQQDQDQEQGGNLVQLGDGTTHMFPREATQDQIQKALGLIPKPDKIPSNFNLDTAWDKAIDFIRPFVGNAAGGIAGTAAGTVSANPILGVAAETQGYAGIDSLMQYLKTNQPKSYKEALTRSEMEAVTNAVAGRILGSVWKATKGVYNSGMPEIYKLAPTTSQVLENYGRHALAKGTGFLEDFGAPVAKAAALDRIGGKGFTQSLALANQLNGRTASVNGDPVKLADRIKDAISEGIDTTETPQFKSNIHYASQDAMDLLQGGRTPYEKLDEVLADRDKLARVLKVGQLTGSPAMNVRKDLGAYQFMKLVNTASTQDAKGNIRFDPNRLMGLWNDPNSQANFDLLYGKESKDRISEFFKTLASVQDKPQTNPFIKYVGKGNFALNLGNLAKHLAVGGSPLGAGISSLLVSSNIVGRLLTSEKLGRAVIEAVEGVKGNIPVDERSRLITNALQGFSGALMDSNNKVIEGSFQEDPQSGGTKFVPYK